MFQLSVYHISLGRGITTDMTQYISSDIERELNRPQNHVSQKRSLKSSPVQSTQERVNIMYNLIVKFNKITRLGIQNRTGWREGIMYSVHRAFMSVYEGEVCWNNKKQQYTLLPKTQETLI